MSVQRFEIAEDENAAGEPCMFPTDEGEWMRYVDHCHKVFSLNSSLAEREQRIAELEAVLALCVGSLAMFAEQGSDAAKQVWLEARAALATEGEKREPT